ncbi:hypothetical protein EMIHUDRAFT_242883 [Emiliania huxleyi CCMP1516]|uniref:Uncharacterized protein n=2 Tax=Emiliania huxleyi TaxID=2903 RepID=A0A0D3J7A6_EMIH1|nr:hypothetical protein EMIHUDRAFT_242883 [Emiliania huxleyi CCMP1516]EOD19391.1 hypothetical protein EMIHUDRAFT_242883 [Emiliania huxleyi CCMP1516]|eukprot:XP_005771820.1 hypothetical protein EMIHUDRAFT_242883 [Emiliania huxleyi CCMP1516]
MVLAQCFAGCHPSPWRRSDPIFEQDSSRQHNSALSMCALGSLNADYCRARTTRRRTGVPLAYYATVEARGLAQKACICRRSSYNPQLCCVRAHSKRGSAISRRPLIDSRSDARRGSPSRTNTLRPGGARRDPRCESVGGARVPALSGTAAGAERAQIRPPRVKEGGSDTAKRCFRGPHELAFIRAKIFIYPQFASSGAVPRSFDS